ncbi:hypothetical protein K501DRAFT_283729 [Backusella circina FSU 941]|nr:hypothetical protein K501DRAFT_283729 [Backusella circina FSU 941]
MISQKRPSLNENSFIPSEVLLRSSSSYYTPPLSTSSSHHSYFQLPAAPEYSSLKKKKKRKVARIIMSDGEESDSRRSSSDIELATEIGQGLLSEIRRMQVMLQEREDALTSERMERKELSKQVLRYKKEIEENKTMHEDREATYKKEINELKLKLQQEKHKNDIDALHISEKRVDPSEQSIEESIKDGSTTLNEDRSGHLEKTTTNESTDDEEEDVRNASSIFYSKEWQRQNMLAHPMVSINEDDFDQADLPAIMHTMMGEWLYKYIRFKVVHGISDHRHRRFFWLHPYTKVLYWCQQEPGGVMEGEWRAKSATIESFQVEEEASDKPAILIKTSQRTLKIACITKDSHEKWVQSLHCLLSKQDTNASVTSATKKKKWRFNVLSSHSLDDVSKLKHSHSISRKKS